MSGVLDSREVLMARSSGLNREDKLGKQEVRVAQWWALCWQGSDAENWCRLCAVGQASGKWREGHVLRGWDCRTYGWDEKAGGVDPTGEQLKQIKHNQKLSLDPHGIYSLAYD